MHGYMTSLGVFLDLSHYLPAIFERKLNIQQDRQRHITCHHLRRNITTDYHDTFVVLLTRIFQQDLCELNIIFNNQDKAVACDDAIAIIRDIGWDRNLRHPFHCRHCHL
ncbi:hypothetical protein D3C71_782570 [compost metagenome]